MNSKYNLWSSEFKIHHNWLCNHNLYMSKSWIWLICISYVYICVWQACRTFAQQKPIPNLPNSNTHTRIVGKANVCNKSNRYLKLHLFTIPSLKLIWRFEKMDMIMLLEFMKVLGKNCSFDHGFFVALAVIITVYYSAYHYYYS